MQPYWQYIVLLGAVVIVGAFVMPRKKQDAAMPTQTIQNMETALEQFMENMEKDNQELVELVMKTHHEAKADAAHKEQRITHLERNCEALAQQLSEQAVLAAGADPKPQSFQTYSKPKVPTPAPATNAHRIEPSVEEVVLAEEPVQSATSIQGRYSQLLELYEQGKSIEAIAKRLGLNKGEVQLIIQLAKQEETAHA